MSPISFYSSQNELLYLMLLSATVFLLLVHYFKYGPGPLGNAGEPKTIRRFSWAERLIHLVRTLTFLLTALTGLHFIFARSSHGEVEMHAAAGFILFVFTLLTLAICCRDSIFTSCDMAWSPAGGRLFQQGKDKPAGRQV
ncbi:MAG: hypothetical protein ACYC4H_13410 [Desulfocucumaceae bacterium]